MVSRLFIIFFVTNLVSFYKQSYSLNGSDLAYHLVGIPPHSTSPIPQGTFSTFGLTLSHGWTICFYFADFSVRTSSNTVSTCCTRKYPYYRPKLLFFTKLDNIFVQYNFGKVCFTDLSEESIHLRVQRNSLLLWKGLLIQVADVFPMLKRIKFNLF